jgi:hypothetical protein
LSSLHLSEIIVHIIEPLPIFSCCRELGQDLIGFPPNSKNFEQVTQSTHHDGRRDRSNEQPHEGGHCHCVDGSDRVREKHSCVSPF